LGCPHIENAAFGSIVASPADSDNRGGSSDADRFDAAGRLAVEPFVDAHVHLDYANTVGRPRPNESGTLFEAIEIWAERKEKGLNDFDEIYGTPWLRPDRRRPMAPASSGHTLTSPIHS
jgi:cytosine/adenosine deaminase-related metal-dependent hydrolase